MARRVDPERYRARRKHIVDAALPLFAQKGLHATSTADICRAAGMSSGNVFHYFASKQEIFEAAFLDNRAWAAERKEDALACEDPWEGLLAFVDSLLQAVSRSHVAALVLEMSLQATRDTAFAEQLAEQDAAEEAVVAELVAAGVSTGRFAPGLEPREAASWVMVLIGAMYLRAASAHDFDPRQQAGNLRLLLERFLRPC